MCTMTFQYDIRIGSSCSVLSLDVKLPVNFEVDDFCERLVSFHEFQIPRFVVSDLKIKLAEFIQSLQRKDSVERTITCIDRVKSGQCDVNSVTRKWAKSYSQFKKDHSDQLSIVNTEFAGLYKKLIHSPSLTSILNVEHAYAMAMQDLLRDKDRTLAELERRQAQEMSDALTGGVGGRAFADSQITSLAQRHCERQQFEASYWEKELNDLRQEQKTQYHEWLKQIDEDPQQSATRARSLSQTMANSAVASAGDRLSDTTPQARLEESFTIHLGAQLKTTHNLRLLSIDMLDLCRHTVNFISGKVVPEPQRLQTALSLYSNKLCGMILLVDDRLHSYSDIKKDFATVCNQSTDFHFPELSEQLTAVESSLTKHHDWRSDNTLPGSAVLHAECSSIKSSGSSESEEKSSRLHMGSFYLTRHSNLSEVHTVFHLVTDDSLSSDINSRHAVILGLRNILKACFKYDVVTLSIPLLLSMELTEEMTIPWCMKRAELVFKCVKGFMMEMSTWADSQSRTIQFVVPKALSFEGFTMLSNMLPEIFRQSNPIVGSS